MILINLFLQQSQLFWAQIPWRWMEKDERSYVLGITSFWVGRNMSDFREVQVKTYLNLISCTKISKPYLNDKYFLQRILNSQIDKYRNKRHEPKLCRSTSVPTDLLSTIVVLLHFNLKDTPRLIKKIVVFAQSWTGKEIWSLASSNNIQ